jgi:hypothetical protein
VTLIQFSWVKKTIYCDFRKYQAQWCVSVVLVQGKPEQHFFLAGLGFELRFLYLKSRYCSITWATPPVHFALVILELFAQVDLRTAILQISASQVARITGMSYIQVPS